MKTPKDKSYDTQDLYGTDDRLYNSELGSRVARSLLVTLEIAGDGLTPGEWRAIQKIINACAHGYCRDAIKILKGI